MKTSCKVKESQQIENCEIVRRRNEMNCKVQRQQHFQQKKHNKKDIIMPVSKFYIEVVVVVTIREY